MSPSPFKYKRPLVAFMAILLLFLIVADVSVVSTHRRQMLSGLKEHWQAELDMTGKFITEALLKHDYANVENFLVMTAKENITIVEINAVTPNNFVLVQYKREKPSAHALLQEKQIRYGDRVLLDLKVVRDFEPEEKILRYLQLQLIAGSLIVTIIMGIVIWFSIRRMALLPLEREIAERRRAEELLQRAKDELETKVQERTSELRKINEDLLLEIAERKRAEEALLTSEERLRLAVSGGRVGIWEWDIATNQLDWNDQLKAIFGLPSSVTGLTLEKFMSAIYPVDLAVTEHSFRTALEQHTEFHHEYRIIRPDGSVHWIVAIGQGIYDPEGHPLRMLGCALDITERKQTEDALKRSENLLQMIIDTEPDCVKMLDAQDNLIMMNRAGLDMLEADTLDEVKGINFCPLVTSEYRQAFMDLTARVFEGQSGTLEFEMVGLKGRHLWLETRAVPFRNEKNEIVALLGITRDISERRKLEQQLLQAQKMESIGHLAGGVAHDFNNILSAIMGYAHIMLMNMKDDDPLRRNLQQILTSSEKAANLTRSLLAFSRKQAVQMQYVNINEIVLSMTKILGRIIGEDINLRVNAADHDLMINADVNQIEQVLMNLASNARDAMPAGGTLTVTTGEFEIDEEYIKMYNFGEVGKYAFLSVADTGMGMDEKTKKNIFDPFFSTKEVGKGTGLGLSMIYGTIKQHNGFINVYSKPGEGSDFKIYLPLAKSGEKVTEKREPAAISSGTETVLLVEDDKDVRNSTTSLLQGFGYSVIEAVDVQQALKLFVENKDIIQLVITDIIMPGQSGKDLYNELMKIAADVKVIFISGYPADALAKKGIIDSDVNLILKPATPEEILNKIREVLDG